MPIVKRSNNNTNVPQYLPIGLDNVKPRKWSSMRGFIPSLWLNQRVDFGRISLKGKDMTLTRIEEPIIIQVKILRKEST